MDQWGREQLPPWLIARAESRRSADPHHRHPTRGRPWSGAACAPNSGGSPRRLACDAGVRPTSRATLTRSSSSFTKAVVDCLPLSGIAARHLRRRYADVGPVAYERVPRLRHGTSGESAAGCGMDLDPDARSRSSACPTKGILRHPARLSRIAPGHRDVSPGGSCETPGSFTTTGPTCRRSARHGSRARRSELDE
jgi:hypothetical protein